LEKTTQLGAFRDANASSKGSHALGGSMYACSSKLPQRMTDARVRDLKQVEENAR